MEEQRRLWVFSWRLIWREQFHRTPHKIFRTLSVFIREMCQVGFLYFLTEMCGEIKGWSFLDLLLCHAYVRLSYGMVLLFFTGLRDFHKHLDKYLLRPMGVLSQILMENTDWFAVVGHICNGCICLIVGLLGSHMRLTGLQVLFFVLNLAGAVFVQAAFWLICDTVSFVYDIPVRGEIFYLFSGIVAYIPLSCIPLSWFPRWIGHVFTFVLPVGFVGFYPALQLLGRTEGMPGVLRYLSLPVGILLYGVAYGFWRWGLWFRRKSRL